MSILSNLVVITNDGYINIKLYDQCTEEEKEKCCQLDELVTSSEEFGETVLPDLMECILRTLHPRKFD